MNSVRLNVNVRETHAMLLDVLSEQHEQHQDLFNSNRLTFSEALAKLYQRLNPQIDMGQRTPQTIGEELLDYRNYLEMEVEVNRGSDGWLRAESGALSTGEAIGTGMSILVMVVQSWEDESRRLRGKDISPCRLLFLDEAARLDARSIATLFELCERLQMQLIIAAPENISPEKAPPINWCVKSSRIPNTFTSSACEDLRRNSLKRFRSDEAPSRRVKMKAAAMPPFLPKTPFLH